ncbi:hypothetical protein V1638_00855 [Pseudarthrobacter sp. J64]|uniref:helix-turn-helix transcriptional regulator n=1 Tax=Pseudarthrobacter sp. J64 TaxID=3116485 RepID=UPI002E81B8FE|nr:hypothetical protein [Pseudarthrobacter sp. J64]MEE2567950.1 hypothetical protein [Pseudarthrobacter sp. J64]
MELIDRDSLLIHASPLFAHALRAYTRENPGVTIRGAFYSWSDFVPARESCPQWVILDAYLDDYVPLLVKVRALSRLGATPVVLGALHPRQQEVLRAAGAAGVISEDLTVPELVAEIGRVVSRWTPTSTPDGGRGAGAEHCRFTDRELQIAELYSRRRGLHASVLGPALGLSPETVRAHLRNARKKLEELGLPGTSRTQLGQALVDMGYSLTDEQWRQAGRW